MNAAQQKLWAARYQRSCRVIAKMVRVNAPKVLLQEEARLLLNAAHGGPWRAIAKLVAHEIKSAADRIAFSRSEWFRRRVLRRTPDPVLEITERVAAEDLELRKIMDEL